MFFLRMLNQYDMSLHRFLSEGSQSPSETERQNSSPIWRLLAQENWTPSSQKLKVTEEFVDLPKRFEEMHRPMTEQTQSLNDTRKLSREHCFEWQLFMKKIPEPTFFKNDHKSAVGAKKNGIVVEINESLTERLKIDHSQKLEVRIKCRKKLLGGNSTMNFDHDKKDLRRILDYLDIMNAKVWEKVRKGKSYKEQLVPWTLIVKFRSLSTIDILYQPKPPVVIYKNRWWFLSLSVHFSINILLKRTGSHAAKISVKAVQ